jgi:uncharacterized membrane protein
MKPAQGILILVLLWNAIIIATPLMAQRDGLTGAAASVSYRFFGHICHQDDARSFHLAHNKFPVCIRCFSIYTFFFVGGCLAAFSHRVRRRIGSPIGVLIIALLPLSIDVALALTGLHQSTELTRIVTGGFAGIGLGLILVPLIAEAFLSSSPQLKTMTHD